MKEKFTSSHAYISASPLGTNGTTAGGSGLFKGGLLLSSGQVVGYALSFLRNVIFARLLTKSDFGLAAALWVALSLFELVNRMGFRNQIIQAMEGDEPGFQGMAHTIQAAAGAVSALMIAAFAYPMALAFRIPDLTWAFACMALVPLARGFMNLDIARFQRELNFRPSVLAELIPQVMATAAAWPLVVWLKDFRAVLVIIIGKEFVVFLMYHLLAERPYRFSWDRNYLKRMLGFSWPLILTGLVMFGSQQGDQMIVGSILSLADLGTYSIAFELSSIPFYIFAAVLSSLLLPTLAKHQDDHEEFQLRYRRALDLCVVGSLLLLAPIVMAGDTIIKLIYGPKYSNVGTLMAIFGAVVALRFFRLAPTVASMSKADTVNQLVSNIARSISLPTALILVGFGIKDMVFIAACGLVGEGLAILVSIIRVHRRQGIPFMINLKPIFFLGSWLLVAYGLQKYLNGSFWVELAGLGTLWVCGILIALLLFPHLKLISQQGVNRMRLRLLSLSK